MESRSGAPSPYSRSCSTPSRPRLAAHPSCSSQSQSRAFSQTRTSTYSSPFHTTTMFRLQQQVKETRMRKETGVAVPKMGHIRVQKDVNEIDIPPSFRLVFPNPDDLMNFDLTITPEDGFYATGSFDFSVNVPEDYPHKPPKVKCNTRIYHPNIDLEGNVCLNILRQDWKPVLTLSSVLYGLHLLFLDPNPDDPLNKDAANLLKKNHADFQRNVSSAIRGGYVAGVFFPSALRR